MTKKAFEVSIFRYDPKVDNRPRYQTFSVPYDPTFRVLDVINYIRENLDSSIGFRWSCRNQRCGLCTVLMNKKPVLACWEQAREKMTIEPLPHLPIIRDLVVDRTRISNRILKSRPFIDRHHQFPEGFHRTYAKEKEAFDTLSRCIDCLSCVVVCPIVEKLRDEFAGPNVMDTLARFFLNPMDEGDRLKLALLEGIYFCTTCRACEEVCPHQIPLPDIAIELMRSELVKKGMGPLPGHSEYIKKVMETGRSVKRIQEPLLETLPELMTSTKSMKRIGFFTGCLVDYRLQKVGKALVEVLIRNGVDVVIPHDQTCCGSPLMRVGEVEKVRKNLVNRNIEAFERFGVDTVLTTCPGCAMTLSRNYPKLLKDVSGENKMPFRVITAAQFLAENIQHIVDDLRPINLRVTWHDPCHLNRTLGIHDEPRTLISKIPGVKFLEMEKSDRCCGAGGGLRAGRKELSYLIGEEKTSYIKALNPDILLTHCPFCELQFTELLGKKPQTLDIIELLHVAMPP